MPMGHKAALLACVVMAFFSRPTSAATSTPCSGPVGGWDEIHTAEYNQTWKLRSKMRKLFGQTPSRGFKSCAVVGNAGLLLHDKGLGRRIDNHDFVIRANLAPVSPFEDLVGHKTSLRIMNTQSIRTVLLERGCARLEAHDRKFCPAYGVLINSFGASADKLVRAFVEACGRYTSPILTVQDLGCKHLNTSGKAAWENCLADHYIRWGRMDLRRTALLERKQGKKKRTDTNVMTGLWAISVAMHLCPGGVTLYGFSSERTEMIPAPYHYFGPLKVNSKTDDLPAFAKMLSELERAKSRCIRLWPSPVARGRIMRKALSDVWYTRPDSYKLARRVDRLVDGLVSPDAGTEIIPWSRIKRWNESNTPRMNPCRLILQGMGPLKVRTVPRKGAVEAHTDGVHLHN